MNANYNTATISTPDVLDALKASGLPLHEWGRATDGAPMLAARLGGDKQPAIFFTAGAHCTEIAGVIASLNLLTELHTEHEAHILPLRDPYGFAGVSHCLSFAAGEPVPVSSHQAALDYLSRRARLLWREGEMRVFQLGEVGFIWHIQQLDFQSHWEMNDLARKLLSEQPQVLKPLWGKSVMLLDPMADSEGAGELQRCYHCVLSSDGQWLHLNRFFGRADAPPETAAVERLVRAVRPGLTCDLHEGHGEGFWLPIPKPAHDAERVFKMGQAYFEYINSRGYPITTYENWLAGDHTPGSKDYMLPEPRLPGFFWVNTPILGGGPNLMDFAGEFGIGFGTEGPMQRPLQMRVDGITQGIQAAVKAWEETLP